MRTNISIAAPLAALSVLIGASACHGATRAGTSRTTVLDQLTITNTAGLDFGRIVASTTAGTVTINPTTGVRTRTGGATLAGGTPSVARFIVTGTENRIVTITGATGAITLSNGTGGTMTVNTFRLNGARNRRLSAAGTVTIQVGARLNVRANQASGIYNGTFNVTVNYQ